MRSFAILAVCGMFVAPVWAADVMVPAEPLVLDYQSGLPAVSGVNGKVEVSGGIINLDEDDDVLGQFYAGGSISIPVGHSFGVQLDGAVFATEDNYAYGSAIHAFTRDPSSYLAGVTASIVRSDDGNTLAAIGPELELYLNQFTIEAWGGLATLDYEDPALDDNDGVFIITDLAWYATDNLRVAVGVSHIIDETSLNLSLEYQLEGFGLPLSLTGNLSIGEDENYTAMVGFKGYFGAPSDRTLIDRHRQDDPDNAVLNIVNGGNGQIFEEAEPDVPDECIPSSISEDDVSSFAIDPCFPFPPV